jgi:hypothetical protein
MVMVLTATGLRDGDRSRLEALTPVHPLQPRSLYFRGLANAEIGALVRPIACWTIIGGHRRYLTDHGAAAGEEVI